MISITSLPTEADCNYEHRTTLTFTPSITLLSTPCLGDLFIDKTALYFKTLTTPPVVFKIDYPTILIHALSRQSPESTAHIYCQLDSIGLIAVTTQDEESVFEMTLMPENALNLDQMFEELSVCASLHPDPTAEEEEEESQWMTGDSDIPADFQLSEEAMSHLSAMFTENKQPKVDQFEDAEK